MNNAYKQWMLKVFADQSIPADNHIIAEAIRALENSPIPEPDIIAYGDAQNQCVVRYFDADSVKTLGIDTDSLREVYGDEFVNNLIHDIADAADRDLREADSDWWPQADERAIQILDRMLPTSRH